MFPERDRKNKNWVVKVGLATCGVAAGGREVYDALSTKLGGKGLNVELKQTGCMGMCYNEVQVEVSPPQGESVFYGRFEGEGWCRLPYRCQMGLRQEIPRWSKVYNL